MAKKFLSQVDLSEIPLKNLVAEQLAGNATTSTNGRVWVDTAAVKLKVWLGAVKTLVTEDRSIAAGTGLTGGGDLSANRTLAVNFGTAAGTVAQGNDSRLSDGRAPTGNAGGKLAGTYPNPSIATGAIGTVEVGATIIPSGVTVGGTAGSAATSDAALRALGFGAAQALPGNSRLDQLTVPSLDLNLNAKKLTNVADPVNAQDAATKVYVDNAIQGLKAKGSVRLATSFQVVANPASAAPTTIDGVNVAVGNRILVKDNTSGSEQNHGIWVVQSVGTGGNGVWTRATDADTWNELVSAFVFVEEGTALKDTGWLSTADAGGTLGTTPYLWTQFSAAGQITAGVGLSKVGNIISLRWNTSRMKLTAGELDLNDQGILNQHLGVGSVNLWTNVISNQLPIANGGTNASTVNAARVNLAVPTFDNSVAVPALTAGTWTTVDVGQKQVFSVVFYDYAGTTGETVEMDWRCDDDDVFQIRADVAVAANVYRLNAVTAP